MLNQQRAAAHICLNVSSQLSVVSRWRSDRVGRRSQSFSTTWRIRNAAASSTVAVRETRTTSTLRRSVRRPAAESQVTNTHTYSFKLCFKVIRWHQSVFSTGAACFGLKVMLWCGQWCDLWLWCNQQTTSSDLFGYRRKYKHYWSDHVI